MSYQFSLHKNFKQFCLVNTEQTLMSTLQLYDNSDDYMQTASHGQGDQSNDR